MVNIIYKPMTLILICYWSYRLFLQVFVWARLYQNPVTLFLKMLPCWNSLFSSGDISTCWSSCKARFLEVMQLCISQTTLRSSRNLPWLTKQVIWAKQLIRKRDAVFRRTKKCRSPAIYQKYRAARNKVTALIRLNKKKFFHSLRMSDAKNFWKAIKLLTKQDSSVPTLLYNGLTFEAYSDKENILNTYFHDCFNKNVSALTPQSPTLDPALFPQDYLRTEYEIYDLIDDFKSTGPDGMQWKCSRQLLLPLLLA